MCLAVNDGRSYVSDSMMFISCVPGQSEIAYRNDPLHRGNYQDPADWRAWIGRFEVCSGVRPRGRAASAQASLTGALDAAQARSMRFGFKFGARASSFR